MLINSAISDHPIIPHEIAFFFSLQSFSWLSLVQKDNTDLEWMVLTVIEPEWPLTPVEAQFDDPP